MNIRSGERWLERFVAIIAILGSRAGLLRWRGGAKIGISTSLFEQPGLHQD